MKPFCLMLTLFALTFAYAQTPSPEAKPEAPTVTTIDAGIGPCTADFTVKDAAGKPVYDAKVHTLIRYGGFGIRKQDLSLGTSYTGQARITGLPDVNKRPTQFDITKGGLKATIAFDPGQDCHPKYQVTLK